MHYNLIGLITIHRTENVKQVYSYFFTTSLQKLLEMKPSMISVPLTML